MTSVGAVARLPRWKLIDDESNRMSVSPISPEEADCAVFLACSSSTYHECVSRSSCLLRVAAAAQKLALPFLCIVQACIPSHPFNAFSSPEQDLTYPSHYSSNFINPTSLSINDLGLSIQMSLEELCNRRRCRIDDIPHILLCDVIGRCQQHVVPTPAVSGPRARVEGDGEGWLEG